MSCKCEHPEPKHKLGLFCIKCNGFIESNNEAREKLIKAIDDQARIHPWFEKKPPTFEGKTTIEVDDEQEKSNSGFQWHEQAPPIKAPFARYGDVVIAEVPVLALMVWSDKIVEDIDEDGNKEFTSGWVMEIQNQKVVYKNHNYTHICNAMPEEETKSLKLPLDKNTKGDFIHRIMSDSDIEILKEHRDLMEDVRTGNYKPDSFTNQPIQILIDRLLNK